MGCERCGAYFEFLDASITSKLADGKKLNGRELGEVLSVSSSIYINQGLGNVTPEQAEKLYQRIFGLFPHLEERLQREREQGFRPPVIEGRATSVNIQAPAENQEVRSFPVDLEDLAWKGPFDI